MSRPVPSRQAGLSLVEVLVALAIVSAIGLAGLTLLDTTLRAHRGTDDVTARMTEVDRALTVLRRDALQADRGSLRLGEGALAFTRAADDGALFSVRYHLQDGALLRDAGIDGARAVPQTLLDGVRAAEWRVLGPGAGWRTEWRPAESGAPRAVELTLDVTLRREAAGRVTRLFPMPARAAR